MADVLIYATLLCPYCIRARLLLRMKGVPYKVTLVHKHYLRDEMEKRSGRTTVPQIFINEIHIGGYDDMAALNRECKLDLMLAQSKHDTN